MLQAGNERKNKGSNALFGVMPDILSPYCGNQAYVGECKNKIHERLEKDNQNCKNWKWDLVNKV